MYQFCKTISLTVLLVSLIFRVSTPPAYAAQNPLAYVNFAFIAGDWAFVDSEAGIKESFVVRPILESGTMKAVLTATDSNGNAFTELWILGWDPTSEFVYLDVYSTGGYRSIMNGKMVVPSKVWVFETPASAGSLTRERRTFTKLSDDGVAIKYELDSGAGRFTEAFERIYSRTSKFTVSGTNYEDTLLTELENLITTAESSDQDDTNSQQSEQTNNI